MGEALGGRTAEVRSPNGCGSFQNPPALKRSQDRSSQESGLHPTRNSQEHAAHTVLSVGDRISRCSRWLRLRTRHFPVCSWGPEESMGNKLMGSPLPLERQTEVQVMQGGNKTQKSEIIIWRIQTIKACYRALITKCKNNMVMYWKCLWILHGLHLQWSGNETMHQYKTFRFRTVLTKCFLKTH